MSELIPCEKCQRHIRSSESECPFCEAGGSKIGSTGALLASAILSVSTLACSNERPATKAPPPVDEKAAPISIDAAPPPASDAEPPASDAALPDAAPAKKKRKAAKKVNPKLPPPRKDVKMPYGAPPARQRLV